MLLALTFIICQESFQHGGKQCLGPTPIKEAIFAARATVSLEKRLCLFSLLFMQRKKNLCTAALKRPLSVSSIREKVFERGEQK